MYRVHAWSRLDVRINVLSLSLSLHLSTRYNMHTYDRPFMRATTHTCQARKSRSITSLVVIEQPSGGGKAGGKAQGSQYGT